METPDQHQSEFEGYLIEIWLPGLTEAMADQKLEVGPIYHLRTSKKEEVEVRSWFCFRPSKANKDKSAFDITMGVFAKDGVMKGGIAGTVYFYRRNSTATYSPWIQISEKGRGYSTALAKAHRDFIQKVANELRRTIKTPLDDLNIDLIEDKIEAFSFPPTEENKMDFVALVGERIRWLALTKDAPTKYKPHPEDVGLRDISHVDLHTSLSAKSSVFASMQEKEHHTHSGIAVIQKLLEQYEVF